MNDLKITITRAYSQKYGDYNKEWASASYTIELPATTTKEEQLKASQELHRMAKQDVLDSVITTETVDQRPVDYGSRPKTNFQPGSNLKTQASKTWTSTGEVKEKKSNLLF